MKEVDVLIIGAGMGSLASAGLWAKKGYKVQVVESHYSTGGCAGYFKRREGLYDVGATTLSGLVSGRPTQRLIKELNLDIKLYPCEIGIVSYWKNKKFRFYKSSPMLKKEMKDVFELNLDQYIDEWISIEEKLWKSLSLIKPLEMIKFKDILQLLNSDARKLIYSPSIFYKSFYDILPEQAKKNEEFIHFIDQLLLISTQQKSRTCPAFMGILGFLYPRDTYAIEGGMYGLCQSLEKSIQSLGADLSLRNRCLRIEQEDKRYIVNCKKESYSAKNIISGISPVLFDTLFSENKPINQKHDEVWGAMTAYFAIKTQKPITELYHQIHVDDSSLFFSFSHPEDKIKSQEFQMVTVSTHIDKNKFNDKDTDYKKAKIKFEEKVLNNFNRIFHDKGIVEIKFDSVGTPLTFKHYTQRPQGEVGGLIHHSLFSLNRLVSNQSAKNRNIYFTGDYSFPGQGIVSVFQSAFNTLTKKI